VHLEELRSPRIQKEHRVLAVPKKPGRTGRMHPGPSPSPHPQQARETKMMTKKTKKTKKNRRLKTMRTKNTSWNRLHSKRATVALTLRNHPQHGKPKLQLQRSRVSQELSTGFLSSNQESLEEQPKHSRYPRLPRQPPKEKRSQRFLHESRIVESRTWMMTRDNLSSMVSGMDAGRWYTP